MRYLAPILLLAGACGRPAAPPVAPSRDVDARVREARHVVRSHAADAGPLLNLAGERVEEFFGPRFGRIDAFVAELFSWRGKWRAAFWGREDYERWARRAFERLLFQPEDFERDVLSKVREDFAYALEASDNRALAEVHAIARADAPALEFAPFAAEVRRLVIELALAIGQDAAMNVVSIAGSEAAAVGAGWALAAAGVCAANSWWNCGIALAVGVVVAVVIDAVVGEVWEDEARMKVHAELVRLRREAVDAVVDPLARAWGAHVGRQEEAVAIAVERNLR